MFSQAQVSLLQVAIQDADNATLHWDWNPVRRPKAVTGHGSAGRRPSLACTGHGSAGRRPSLGTGVPAEGRLNMIHRPSVTQMVRLIIMAATTLATAAIFGGSDGGKDSIMT